MVHEKDLFMVIQNSQQNDLSMTFYSWLEGFPWSVVVVRENFFFFQLISIYMNL